MSVADARLMLRALLEERFKDQLGLKLEPSEEPRETLIIERLERPTEN